MPTQFKKSLLLFLKGYLFISVLVNSNSELIRLINNAIKNDLSSRNPTFMCLALHCIANVGSREMAEAFASEIPRILVAGWVWLLLLMVEDVKWKKKKKIVSFFRYLCFAVDDKV